MGSGKYCANAFPYAMVVIPSYLGQSRSQNNGDNCSAGDAPDIARKEIPTLNPCVHTIEESSHKVSYDWNVNCRNYTRAYCVCPFIDHLVYTLLKLFLWNHEHRTVVNKQPCGAARLFISVGSSIEDSACDSRNGCLGNSG